MIISDYEGTMIKSIYVFADWSITCEFSMSSHATFSIISMIQWIGSGSDLFETSGFTVDSTIRELDEARQYLK